MEEEKFKCKSCSKEEVEKVNIQRFISKLDSYFNENDLEGARSHLEYWEKEAINLNDNCGLLSILNEKIGFSRKVNDKEMATLAIDKALKLINQNSLNKNISGATICINIATTLKAFNRANEALPIYELAASIYKDYNKENTYEYATLLNNKATALQDLKRYDEAIELINKAIEILKKDNNHDGEIAISLINLAHIIYDRNDNDTKIVEKTLDEAWDYITSSNNKFDGNFAYILTKCAPSLRYFKRELEANTIEEIADKIYKGEY